MKVLSSPATPAPAEARYLFEFANLSQATTWLRVVVYAALYVVFLLLQLFQSDFLSVNFWQPVHLLMAVAFSVQMVLIFSFDSGKWTRPAVILGLCTDALILSVFLSIWGVPHAGFLFFLLMLCSIASLSLGFNSGLKFALWGSLAFHTAIALSPFFQPEALKTAWVVNNASILAVTVLGGLLGEQLKNVTYDIEQKREEIQTLTDVNQLLVENMASGLFLTDAKFQIVRSNRGSAKIFNDLALEGRSMNEVSPALHAVLANEAIGLEPGAAKRFEVDHYNYRKEKMILEVVVSRVRKTQAQANEFVCLVQNLTEIRQLEMAMRQKEKLAAVGQLAAGIAHEIRNPLASISGSVQLLQTGLQTQTPEDKKLFAIVIKEIDRLNKLITEFLDFVRPDIRLEDPIALNNLSKEILDMVKMNKSLLQTVEQKTQFRAQGLILGHYDKLKQALLNIVINAYQAMGDTLRPEISVQTYDAEGKVVLIIEDNGMGMTPDNLKRLFEPFHTTKPRGTGLGLAITHKILETHEAEMFVDSRLGHGTKFTLVFKAKETKGRV